MRTWILALTPLFLASTALAQPTPCVPPPGGKCITKEQLEQITKALQELDDIHKSPAVITVEDQIYIISDWNGAVYVNGGDKDPIKMKLKMGQYVDRDMAATIPTHVYYRPKPPDPMFRLRVRAQAGVLLPQAFQSDTGWNKFDGGLSFDFFHIKAFNVAAFTGIRSAGGGIGLDLTNNFGIYGGYSFVYDGFKSSSLLAAYFSFN
jgi:hypothetical protein